MESLTPEQLALLKTMLERRLADLARVEQTQPDAGELPVDEVETSPLDRATARLLNDLTREAAGHHSAEMRQLRQALARFDDGSYGFCEECGQPIGASRLLARPEARLCIDCQTRAERR
ncbi:MAG: TraR/DksA family transcriptional regulator [Massilia sp.]|nr:TraR/DksA family transcriptional regulator [Massilia sp.]